VGEVPWAHLDIAGPAWTDKEDAYITKGGTGTGVRTVLELLSSGALPRPKRSRART
jgi:leucyl aminopeptidase